jgi:hypothetical protein
VQQELPAGEAGRGGVLPGAGEASPLGAPQPRVDRATRPWKDRIGYVPLFQQERFQRHWLAATWNFKAAQPPGDHPFGAYFTTLTETTPLLARRLRIPKEKVEYVFSFADVGDLKKLRGDRGEISRYSPADYPVEPPRQSEPPRATKLMGIHGEET